MAIGQQTRSGKAMPGNSDNARAPLARGKGFLHEVLVELQKTTWPTRKEAWRLTMVVMTAIVIVAFYVGALDFVLSWLTKRYGLIK